MVLQADFLLDGADHARLFDFEMDLTKGKDMDAENQNVIGKQKEQRFKTVVCRHWVMDLCMKMDECEYLHELNPARMPECRWGEKCQVPDCIFKHTKEEDRIECAFYKIGFCRKGPTCRFRHVRRAPEECPEEIKWEEMDDVKQLTLTEVTTMEEGVEKKMLVQHNENYKVAICKHWQKTGVCPFGERCHFAHGQHELRQRPGEDENAQSTGPPRTELQNVIQGFQRSAVNAPRNPVSDLGEDLRTPDRELVHNKTGRCAYFVVRTRSQSQVAASLKNNCWSVLPCYMGKLNEAFDKAPQVFLFFVSEESREFMGCALMKTPVQVARDVPFVELPEAALGFSFLVEVRWLYTCSLEFDKTAFLMSWEEEVFMDLPVAMAFECTELHPAAGHALMVMMFREPLIEVDVSSIGDVYLSVHMEGPDPELYGLVDDHIERMSEYIKENPGYLKELRGGGGGGESGSGQLLGPDGVPVGPGSIQVPDRQGFIIGCTSRQFVREMLYRSLLAGPESKKSEMSIIQRGTFILLCDLEEGKIHGIFEALSPAEDMLEPRAFRENENDIDAVSELPVQVQVRRAMNTPPIYARQVPNTILQTDGGETACFVRIAAPQMQNIANLFARSAGNRQRNQQSSANQPTSGGAARSASEYPPGISVQDVPSGKPDMFTRTVIVNIPFRPQFKAAHRIIGKGGTNIKRIQETGVRCTVKPLGNQPADGGQQQEINGPMQVIFFSSDPANLDEAEGIVLEMVEDLERKHEEYLRVGEQMRNSGPPRGGDRGGGDRYGGNGYGGPRGGGRPPFPSPRSDERGGNFPPRDRFGDRPYSPDQDSNADRYPDRDFRRRDDASVTSFDRVPGARRPREDEISVGSGDRGFARPPPNQNRDRDDIHSVASLERGNNFRRGRGGRGGMRGQNRNYEDGGRGGGRRGGYHQSRPEQDSRDGSSVAESDRGSQFRDNRGRDRGEWDRDRDRGDWERNRHGGGRGGRGDRRDNNPRQDRSRSPGRARW